MSDRGKTMKCNQKTEMYSRIVGYFRPVQNWNQGKKQEFVDRQVYSEEISREKVLIVQHDSD
jgi:anaerobic ribonucleoside-triphosphate reductase